MLSVLSVLPVLSAEEDEADRRGEGERADKGPVLWMAHWTGNSVVSETTRGSVAGGTLCPRLVTSVASRYLLPSPIDWRRLELAVAVPSPGDRSGAMPSPVLTSAGAG